MSIESLERTLSIWKRELKESPDKTAIKQMDVDKLLKEIDKVYTMESKIQRYVDKVQLFVNKERF